MAPSDHNVILVVEDDGDSFFLLNRSMNQAGLKNPIRQVCSVEEGKQYFMGEGRYQEREAFPLPTLVLLDIHMFGGSGLELLRWIRQQPKLKALPVIMLTSSQQASDVVEAYSAGANAYLVKPMTVEKGLEMVQALDRFWFSQNHFVPRIAAEL
jgi:DNA-binding response OmpR family regulator